MKKIAIILPKDSEALFNKNCTRTFGGASVQLYNIAKELWQYNNIVTYSLIPKYQKIDFDDYDKFNLIMLYKETDNAFVKFIKMVKFLLQKKPDALIQRGLTLESCLVALLCKLCGVRFVFMFAHDVEAGGLRQKDRKPVLLMPLLIKYASVLITQNSYQKQMLLNKYHKESIIIYNGYDIPHYKPVKKKYILWVARCDSWKQPELFIELAKKNKRIPFVMICPKSANEQYYRTILNKAINIPNCTFIDFVEYSEINEFFQQAYIFVNTSLYEGFPQTFIQACMNHTPIVSLNVNPEECLTKHECGVFCNGSVDAMNAAIHKLWNNKAYWKTLSSNAYRYAVQYHDITKNVQQLVNLIFS